MTAHHHWYRFIAIALAGVLSGCAPTRPAIVDVDVHAATPATATAVAVAASGEPEARHATGTPLVAAPYRFAGTWRSADGSILRLGDVSFYLRFPHDGGIRENFGTIVEVDEPAGHIVIRYDKSLFNGAPTHVPSETGYMTYVIQHDVLRKWIASDLPFQNAADEEFARIDDGR